MLVIRVSSLKDIRTEDEIVHFCIRFIQDSQMNDSVVACSSAVVQYIARPRRSEQRNTEKV